VGGITCGRDALDFLAAGATCIAAGTESFRDPSAEHRIGAELSAIRQAHGAKRAYLLE